MDSVAYLTPHQVEAIVAACRDPRDRLLVRLYWRTGARVSEVIMAKREQVKWTRGTMLLARLKARKPAWREIALDEVTLRMLREHLKTHNSSYIFPGQTPEGHLARGTAYRIVREATERIGVRSIGEPLVNKQRHPSPRLLRRSFVVHAIKAAGDSMEGLIKVQTLMGHRSVQTTALYRPVSLQESRELLHRMFPD